MNIAQQLTQQFRQLHFGGNWTSVNLKDTLEDVDWKMAITKVQSLNTIAALVFHINYYVVAVTKVLHGEPLNAKDKYSFDLPPIESQDDWNELKNKCFSDAEHFAVLIENFPDEKLEDIFVEPKYGNYYRNFMGIIEHTHYHLGQVVLIKKLQHNYSTK